MQTHRTPQCWLYRYDFSVVPPVKHPALDEQYPTHCPLAFTKDEYSENQSFNILTQFSLILQLYPLVLILNTWVPITKET